MDDLVRLIASDASGQTSTPWVLCAIGGYGRGTLCLHSDIDLLIVFDGRLGRPEEQFVNALLQPLWDLGLTIGHQIRELAELADLDEVREDNPEFLLALLDARFVAGNTALFDGWQDLVPRKGQPCPALLTALLSLVSTRHARFNDTFYQLEPDIKEAPSGLRDVDAIRWIAELADDPSTVAAAIEREQLDESEDFLLRIRSVLHVECGRNRNVLSHRLQERVAEVLGYDGATDRTRVESLMRDYFQRARSVARTLESVRGVARGLPPRTRDRSSVDDGAESRAATEWAAVRDLLTPRPGLYARLSEMHDSGALTRVFPELAGIHCRVIRDFYHKYTVDEHTLLTLRSLESLRNPDDVRRRFAGILHELHAPELLSVALLFHDTGKWQDADHVSESVRLACGMLERVAAPEDARHAIEFLIRNHLQMSLVAFRRDAEDPEVVRQFADLVRSEELLKMLCLMTLVDVEAVGPGTLTPWKAELLWRLYVDTYNQLTLGYADELIEKDVAGVASLQASRPADITDVELSRFLGGLPRRYLALFDAERIYRHVRLSREIRPGHVHPFLEKKDTNWELTVLAADRPFLFSSVTGVLAYFGMDILRGQAMTTSGGLVLDVFEFSDTAGFLRHNVEAPAMIGRQLDETVGGRKDVTELLRGMEQGVYRRRPSTVTPVVHFANEHSHKYTVLEIVARDEVGLLYRISHVISSHQCEVDLVLIATEGDMAIDVFHVTSGGARLSSARQLTLKKSLEQMLESRHETH